MVYHLKKHPIQGLKWQFSKLEQESHGSISLGQGYLGLQDYYADWADPHFENTRGFEDKGGIEYLQALQALYAKRTPSVIPIRLLDHMALLYLDEQRANEAIELSLLAVKEQPTSGRALRNLAYVYEKLKMEEKALQAYEQALATAILNKHKASSITLHRKALAEFKAKQQ